MNSLQIFLLILAAVFVVLIPLSRTFAAKYARFTVLVLVAALMLMPFAWLVCAAFKSTDAMNQYSFLPPPSQISAKTVNLGNFRSLFSASAHHSGPGDVLALRHEFALSRLRHHSGIPVLLLPRRLRLGKIPIRGPKRHHDLYVGFHDHSRRGSVGAEF